MLNNREFKFTYDFNSPAELPIIPIMVFTEKEVNPIKVKCLLDTGANKSCITETLIKRLRLIPIKRGEMYYGVYTKRSIYSLNFILTKDIAYLNLEAMGIEPPPSDIYHALIGMDIISTGNLSIESLSGKTKITFRVRK